MNITDTIDTTVPEKNGMIPLNLADFYKTGHPGMYPGDTTKLVANFTPRADHYAPVLPELYDHRVVWFGLQGFMKEFLIDTFNRDFFQMPIKTAVRKYKRRLDNSLGVNSVSMSRIEALHKLGYLPIEVRSLPEGSRVNIKVPPVMFISTHRDFAWVVTYIETLMSTESWKPSTVATIAFEFRKLFTYFARETGTPEEFIDIQGHDFSMRGMSGVHDATRSSGGHSASFLGTDTIPVIDYLEDYYGANSDIAPVGISVPASEHSVMALRILRVLAKLKLDRAIATLDEKALRCKAEEVVIREFVTQDYPSGVISIVSDTFDFWNTITNVARALKNEILARTPNALGFAKVVFRPDSGDPVKILTGYKDSELVCGTDGKPTLVAGAYVARESGVRVTEAERKGAVECLWDIFRGTVTDKGYKLLDSHVGLIYGDSITLKRALQILLRLKAKGFASGNVVFGIGSYVYQYITRDTFGWAMKAIYAEMGDECIEIYKDPATDDGTKKSACGLQRVEETDGGYVMFDHQTPEQFEGGALIPVFRNSQILVEQTHAGIKERLLASWVCPEPGSIEWREAA